MRQVWERFDSVEGGTRLFGSLISVLNRLMTEKPVLLGVSSQMFGVGVSSHHSDDRVPSTATVTVLMLDLSRAWWPTRLVQQ